MAPNQGGFDTELKYAVILPDHANLAPQCGHVVVVVPGTAGPPEHRFMRCVREAGHGGEHWYPSAQG